MEEEELDEQIKEVEGAHASQQHNKCWKLINTISGRKTAQASKIKGESEEQRIQALHGHFKKLLGNPPQIEDEPSMLESIFTNLPIKDTAFTKDEYIRAKKSLKAGKSAGEDGVPTEVLKWVPIDDIILGIINRAYSSGEIPEQWKILNIVPIPKSGDLSLTDNYRGISLSSVVAKTYNRMILNRVRPVLDPLLRKSQNGFRQKRTTIGQILALRRILEGAKKRQLPAVITFIDFKKAFDTIHRGMLMKILTAYGLPDKLIQAIKSTYDHTTAKVLSPDGETPSIDILAGVLQGDTLAPYLFIVVLDYALRKATSGKDDQGFTITPRKSRRVPPVTITDLDFADDIALLSDTVAQAQEMLVAVEAECKRVGLMLNSKKTKVMALNTDSRPCIKTIEGSILEVTDDFQYLGGWMESSEKDISVRRALAWKALHGMKKVWKTNLSDNIKRRLFVATVESVLLYGCETWTMTTSMERSMDGCYTRMLRMALNVSWREHLSNSQLYRSMERVSTKIRIRRLKMAGHCVRHPELSVSPLVLWEPTHGRAVRGRAKLTYIELLKGDTGCASTTELQIAMTNRDVWRGFIGSIRAADPASTR